MKKIFYLLILIFLLPAVSVFGQEEAVSKLELFIRDDFEDISLEQKIAFKQRYDQMLLQLSNKQSYTKSESVFLENLFYRVHRKFLKGYEQHVLFSEIFKPSGKYDCVTGSALYALFLEDLGFKYEVIETDYHVYIIVNGEDKDYLFEATDPLNGFSKDQKEIAIRRNIVLDDAKRINIELAMSGVSEDQSQSSHQEVTINVINNSIGIRELAGLHYYNQSLKKLNNGDYKDAFKYVSIAQGIYPSQRIKNTSSLIFAVAFSD